MSPLRTTTLASALALVAMAAAGCGSSSSSCSDSRTCGTGGASGSAGTGGSSGSAGTSGSGGTDGGAGTGGASGAGGDGGGCDTSKSPGAESCLVSDTYAVFVDGTVATSGDGSQASPYKTIGEAVAKAGGKIILVCDTTYDEQVKLTAGAKIYGGFKCADWSYQSGQRAVVKPSTQGYALEVANVTDPVVIDDMEFDSADATAAGGSSIAAFVHGSKNVALHRDKLVAGKGMAGKNGVLQKLTYPTQMQLNGSAANNLAGGSLKQCACPAGDQSIGAHGGDGPTLSNGGNGLPNLGGGQGGTALSPTDCSQGAGKNGNNAPPETPAAGASSSGTLDASGWTPSNGTDGKAGGPGQGGGGGASSSSGSGAGGGGGGCGGCGGAGGPGGGGGGASVALMVLDSTVSVDAGSQLVTSAAGDGGSGATGQAGETITGNGGIQASGACPGGAGGKGGAGAGGGGGAGGISVAVLWKGSAPPAVDSGATLTPGTQGAAGTGGKAGTNDGIDGISQGVLQVQ